MVMVQAFNPRIQVAEAGGYLWVCGQANLQELVSDQAPNLQRIPVSKIINKFKSRIDIAIMHIFDFVV